MRTPEQILDECHERDAKEKGITCIMPDHFPAAYAGSALMAMQEHAIEFLEWANREQTYNHLKGRDDYGWYYEKPSKYPWGVREEFIGDTRDLYKLYLKSIEPKTTLTMQQEQQWEVKSHSYQIADTGDYDGFHEITNGTISLCTKDDPEDGELQTVADALNKSLCTFYLDDSKEAGLHFEIEGLKIQLKELSEGQSAGTWVKASERTPDNDDVLHVKIDGIRYMGNFFDAELPGERGFYVQSNGAHEGWVIEQNKFSGILWLDEGTPPDNKEREVAFVKWLGENCNYWPKSEEGAMNSKTYSLEQLHGIWQQSLTNKP